jgi:hypothetical protein
MNAEPVVEEITDTPEGVIDAFASFTWDADKHTIRWWTKQIMEHSDFTRDFDTSDWVVIFHLIAKDNTSRSRDLLKRLEFEIAEIIA